MTGADTTHRLAIAELPEPDGNEPELPQVLVSTTGFADVDTGLAHAESEVAVRCEIMAAARASRAEVAAAVIAAAEYLTRAGGAVPAQPGVMLPRLAEGTALEETDCTVSHGLLISPYLWEGQVPQVAEEGRLTLVCQLLMLTDAEYAYAVDEGVEAFQQAVAQRDIDLLDWSRATE